MTYTEALAREGDAPPLRAFTSADHPNAIMLKNAHEAFQKGDLDALFGLMAPDCTWHMPGDNVLAGTFVGRDQIMQSFGALQANVDAYWAFPLDYFGSDDHVVLVALVRARRRDRALETKECLLWRVDDAGKLCEVWHMALDHKAWDDFFAPFET
ncbi:nuclear transport factor 2 family protein [Sphingobium algorifonticola]|uniref:Nuclear transport factor 2 family protein n=1 Tax=Sphingobium algorifonticola TaxID=2008318 RepID=A0A437J9T5_9SPHN|nr:nuclear transport factor 2 family protein [Sphingobium algorifonticola]RVT42276.1 nuclear transport factor 2 family protein [Sphingobium algorifonticola]